MIKSLQVFILKSLLILACINVYKLQAQTPCHGHSVTVEDITITSMTTSGVHYNYTIRNTGSTTVSTNNLVINNRLSTDASGTSTIAAGGSTILGSVTLAPNDTYSGTFQSSITNYPAYPYLLMRLEYGVSGSCQVNLDEEFECLRPDAEIVGFTIDNTQPASISYQFELKNVGADTLYLDELELENFLSVDNAYDGSDVAAGSETVTIPSATYLLANESGTVTYTTSGSISGYNYLITRLTYSEQSECLTTNNEAVTEIPEPNGLLSPVASETNFIIWNAESKSFTVQTGAHAAGTSLQYQLFNAAGMLESSGNVNVGASTFVSAKGGFYVLVISDGEKSYSKKIIY